MDLSRNNEGALTLGCNYVTTKLNNRDLCLSVLPKFDEVASNEVRLFRF